MIFIICGNGVHFISWTWISIQISQVPVFIEKVITTLPYNTQKPVYLEGQNWVFSLPSLSLWKQPIAAWGKVRFVGWVWEEGESLILQLLHSEGALPGAARGATGGAWCGFGLPCQDLWGDLDGLVLGCYNRLLRRHIHVHWSLRIEDGEKTLLASKSFLQNLSATSGESAPVCSSDFQSPSTLLHCIHPWLPATRALLKGWA